MTFEALKRAQLVPNFETRISIAKKRGVHHASATSSSTTSSHHQQPKRSLSTFARSSTSTTRDGPTLSRQSSLSQLVFNKGSSNTGSTTPPGPQSPPVTTTGSSSNNSNASSTTSSSNKPNAPLTLRTNREALEVKEDSTATPNSPSATFFQQTQRANATPVTMTNPFAKLSNFVNAYIVLQEFCKELAAVILVRHATNYNDTGLVKYHQHEASASRTSMLLPYDWDNEHNSNYPPLRTPQSPYFHDRENEDHDWVGGDRQNMDKWKNRISMVSTLADWRSVRSLDIIDEAITARVRSASSDGKW